MGLLEYKTDECCLFIDRSKRILNYVISYNGKKYDSIPIIYLTSIKEKGKYKTF